VLLPVPNPTSLPPFGDIVRQHQAMVYSIAWHFLRDRTVAEDLAQDVFLGLHRNLAVIESPSHLTNWLRQAMTRRCIDWSRRSAQKMRVSLEAVKEPSAPARHGDPFVSDQIGRAMAYLPERSRMMVVLRFQEDLDPTEIAELLAVPVGTVKSTLHRALAVMRGRLKKIGNGASVNRGMGK
jgi:RNA polymerase sigma-70 factor (ECF subfamily)